MVAVDHLHEFETEVPAELQARFREIVSIVDRFCEERLDAEFQEVSRRILACYCQPGTNIGRGKAESWAAGVVYEAGQVNFLTDDSFEPCCKSEEIAKGCGVSVATMHNKGRDIRKELQLMRFDPSFTVKSRLENNPLAWLMELPDGMIISLKDMPAELREKLDAAGLLPENPDQARTGNWRERKIGTLEPYTGVVYTLKITLKDSHPPIWRRVQLPDCTLEQLHYVIQAAMGWENSHLHEFVIGQQRFQATSGGFAVDMMWNAGADETEATEDALLSDVIPESSKQPFRFTYTYDFGDGWEHEIVVESVEIQEEVPNIPVCLDGKRACPPEDCGGVWGYVHLLEALGDRKHPDHRDMREWCGPLDPEEFDPNEVNKFFQKWVRRS